MMSEQKITQVLTADASRISPPADLLARIKGGIAAEPRLTRPSTSGWTRRRSQRILAAVAAVAAVVTVAVMAPWPGTSQYNVLAAMERAAATLHSYHGVLADGTEVWHDGNKFAIHYPDGRVAVNNGEHLWEQDPAERKVYISVGMSGNSGYNVRDIGLPFIVGMARQYLNTIEGEETVAGRQTTRVRVTIDESRGLVYRIWIDHETDLPLQWEEWEGQPPAYHRKTFTKFEVNPQIDPAVFAYQVPAGYDAVERGGHERRVQSAEEAAAISGVMPLLPKDAPQQMWAAPKLPLGWVVLEYPDASVVQLNIREPLVMDGQNVYGTAAGGPLEVTPFGTLRWYQDGKEITVSAPPQSRGRAVELARQIAPDLTMPNMDTDLVGAAQVKVPVDLAEAEALQKRAEEWKPSSGDGRGNGRREVPPPEVDISSRTDARNWTYLWGERQGVTWDAKKGDGPIVRVVANNGFQAVMEVNQGPYRRVYMQRVARQDYMGLWFVVGYDPR